MGSGAEASDSAGGAVGKRSILLREASRRTASPSPPVRKAPSARAAPEAPVANGRFVVLLPPKKSQILHQSRDRFGHHRHTPSRRGGGIGRRRRNSGLSRTPRPRRQRRGDRRPCRPRTRGVPWPRPALVSSSSRFAFSLFFRTVGFGARLSSGQRLL